jgi:hypothetical protein
MRIYVTSLIILDYKYYKLSIDVYIAKKIFELTNCENKSLRELSLFNFESGFKNIPNCRSVQ